MIYFQNNIWNALSAVLAGKFVSSKYLEAKFLGEDFSIWHHIPQNT